ncbi:hypothetical protein GQ600_17025 [Phytophthora cactorum]|nr:hypothetical protein GQ600_17025 [Phytophthora cactorum]
MLHLAAGRPSVGKLHVRPGNATVYRPSAEEARGSRIWWHLSRNVVCNAGTYPSSSKASDRAILRTGRAPRLFDGSKRSSCRKRPRWIRLWITPKAFRLGDPSRCKRH